MKNIKPAEIISSLLIILFAYTATSKLLEYNKFIFQMSLAPVAYIKLMAPVLGAAVIAAEVAIIAALLHSRFRLLGLYASLFLLLSFEIYISAMLLSGSELPCSCGGFISALGWKPHLLFNGAFIILSIVAIINYEKHKAYQDNINRSESLNDLSRVA